MFMLSHQLCVIIFVYVCNYYEPITFKVYTRRKTPLITYFFLDTQIYSSCSVAANPNRQTKMSERRT